MTGKGLMALNEAADTAKAESHWFTPAMGMLKCSLYLGTAGKGVAEGENMHTRGHGEGS